MQFEKPTSVGEVRDVLNKANLHGTELQGVEGGSSVLIRVPRGAAAADSVGDELYGIIQKAFPERVGPKEKAIERAEYVGPAVGRALGDQAFKAIVGAAVLIIIYVGFRFRSFLWGFCSIAAVLHDVLSVVGIFSILNKEITVTVVAGILTLAGYSMNDTIVIFDRMRENLRLNRKEPLGELINRSINETLSRTIMTSVTVAIVLLVLFFFGGEVIHDFSFAMLYGVFVGSYSTIFIAAPLIYEWHVRRKPSTPKAKSVTVKR
jgi:preprotein translocase SecF subunit